MRKDQSAICLHSWLLPYSMWSTSASIEVLLTLASALCSYSIRELCHRLPCRRQISPARTMGYRRTRRLRASATARLQPSTRNPHSLLHLKSRFPAEHHNKMVRWRNLPQTYDDIYLTTTPGIPKFSNAALAYQSSSSDSRRISATTQSRKRKCANDPRNSSHLTKARTFASASARRSTLNVRHSQARASTMFSKQRQGRVCSVATTRNRVDAA